MINWKQKLSSRKFWVALVGFISAMLFAFNYAEADIERIVSVIMAGSTLIIYILTEGYVDSHRESGYIVVEDDEEIE
jgi:uncharacterized membrane protein